LMVYEVPAVRTPVTTESAPVTTPVSTSVPVGGGAVWVRFPVPGVKVVISPVVLFLTVMVNWKEAVALTPGVTKRASWLATFHPIVAVAPVPVVVNWYWNEPVLASVEIGEPRLGSGSLIQLSATFLLKVGKVFAAKGAPPGPWSSASPRANHVGEIAAAG